MSNELTFPNLPNDLNIGKAIANWKGDTALIGTFTNGEMQRVNLPIGNICIIMHTKGIRIFGNDKEKVLELHFSQIISLVETTQRELSVKDKSVLGRAIVGGVLLGGVGAIVGGMTGIGNKSKMEDKPCLIVNYWDLNTKEPVSILLNVNSKPDKFINRFEKERNS